MSPTFADGLQSVPSTAPDADESLPRMNAYMPNATGINVATMPPRTVYNAPPKSDKTAMTMRTHNIAAATSDIMPTQSQSFLRSAGLLSSDIGSVPPSVAHDRVDSTGNPGRGGASLAKDPHLGDAKSWGRPYCRLRPAPETQTRTPRAQRPAPRRR